MFFDDSLKFLKKEFKDVGVDMGIVRDFQKSYDKVMKQAPSLQAEYEEAKSNLHGLCEALQLAEERLIEGNSNSFVLQELYNRMKTYQGKFAHEFLVSSENMDFHTTYESILRLCKKDVAALGQTLILQSEIENLIAMVQEALERELPGCRELAFYYLSRSDKELYDMPHPEKLAKVNRIYEREFIKPMRDALSVRLTEARVKQIMEDELWKY